MNRLEFNEVINTTDINNLSSSKKNNYKSDEDLYCWNDIEISFSGSYYSIINGKVPLEVANIIYEKYPNNPYNIRINGGSNNLIPIEQATDDQYENDIEKYIDEKPTISKYLEECEKAKKELDNRNDCNKYINKYHIDTKEGLLIFIIEMKDYFLRKNNLDETEVKKYNELIKIVNEGIIKKINPTISAYEWMQGDKENKDKYNFTIERDSKTKIGRMFREAILNFDKAVNPFLNYEIEFDEIENYLEKISISASVDNYMDGKYRDNCCNLKISELKTNNSTCYYRSPDGFSFQLMYKLNDKEYISVLHYFSSIHNYEDTGEVIAVVYLKDNSKKSFDMRLNVTTGKIEGTKSQASIEQIGLIYDWLVKATEYALSVTLENMVKKEKVLKKI